MVRVGLSALQATVHSVVNLWPHCRAPRGDTSPQGTLMPRRPKDHSIDTVQ